MPDRLVDVSDREQPVAHRFTQMAVLVAAAQIGSTLHRKRGSLLDRQHISMPGIDVADGSAV
jgi:hypothetical protein